MNRRLRVGHQIRNSPNPEGPVDHEVPVLRALLLAGVSDNVYGIDVASGQQIWKRKFDSTFVEQPGGRFRAWVHGKERLLDEAGAQLVADALVSANAGD